MVPGRYRTEPESFKSAVFIVSETMMFWPATRKCCKRFGPMIHTVRTFQEARFASPLTLLRRSSNSACVLNVKPCPRSRLHYTPSTLLYRRLSLHSSLNARRTFELSTSPFGEIVIVTKSGVETTVLPLDPQKYPLQNKVFIDIESPGNKGEIGPDDVHVSQEGATIRLTVNEGQDENSKIICIARLPIKYDIGADIRGNSDISVEKFENEHVNIHSESGLCRIKAIQTGAVDIESRSGNIICEGVLQGNSNLKIMGAGDISVHKIQGLTFKAETQSGDIEAKAVYADHSDFLSRSGEIRLGSCHRDCSIKIEEKGNVHVGSLDGNLSVEVGEGDVEINYVAQHEKMRIQTQKGDVEIKLSDKLRSYMHLEGTHVSLADDFEAVVDVENISGSNATHLTGVVIGHGFDEAEGSDILEATSRNLIAQTKQGTVTVKSADWFSSLNLMAKLD